MNLPLRWQKCYAEWPGTSRFLTIPGYQDPRGGQDSVLAELQHGAVYAISLSRFWMLGAERALAPRRVSVRARRIITGNLDDWTD